MRCLPLLLLLAACKPGGVSKEAELCSKAAAMFERCEQLDGSGSDAALSHELTIDRWRGLCRAVFTGETAQLMPNARELYQALDEPTRAAMRKQAECTSKATNCLQYAACEQ